MLESVSRQKMGEVPPSYEVGTLPVPVELLEMILHFLPSSTEVAKLNLVCKEWRVVLNSMYKTIIHKQWPHLYEKWDSPSTPWALYYSKKMLVDSNLENCRFSTYCLTFPRHGHDVPEIHPLNHQRIALLRQTSDRIPVPPCYFPKQIDIVCVATGQILQTIEVRNAFHIRDNILYVDVDDEIRAYNLVTGECQDRFEGYEGKVIDLYVDLYQCLIVYTKTGEYEFGLYSWNIETKEFYAYKTSKVLDNKKFRIQEGREDTLVLRRSMEGHFQLSTFVTSFLKNSESHNDCAYLPAESSRYILHENLTIVGGYHKWKIFSDFAYVDPHHIIVFVITEPGRLITLTYAEDTQETHVQCWDILKKEKVSDIVVQDISHSLVKASFYNIFKTPNDRLLLVGNHPDKLEEFIAVIDLATGHLILRKLRENALDLPNPDTINFAYFDNQIVTFKSSTSEKEFTLRIVKFDVEENEITPSQKPVIKPSPDPTSFQVGTLATSHIAFQTFKEKPSKHSTTVEYTNKGYHLFKGVVTILGYGYAIGTAILSLAMTGVLFLYHRLVEPRLKNKGHKVKINYA